MEGYVLKSSSQRMEDLRKDIEYLLLNNPVTVLQITKRGLSDNGLARTTLGEQSNIAGEAMKVAQEIQAINYIEERLLKYIVNNLNSFDIDSAEKVVMILDKLSRTTFADYNKVLDEIENAIKEKDDNKQVRPEKGLTTLLTNRNYTNMVAALTEDQNKIRAFLDYEPEFWEFIKLYERVVPVPVEGAKIECGILPIMETDGKTLHSFYTLVPKVIDMETAYMALDIYKKAHDMYLMVGKEYTGGVQKPSTEEQLDYRDYLNVKGQVIAK